MKSLDHLSTWQLTKHLSEEIFELSEAFPSHVRLSYQPAIQNSVIKAQASIAKAITTEQQAIFIRRVKQSKAHLTELETQLRLGHDLNFINEENYIGLQQAINSIYLGLLEHASTKIRT